MSAHVEPDWQLFYLGLGRLCLVSSLDGGRKEVLPVRAFPLTHPDAFISLVGQGGKEELWIENLSVLQEEKRYMVKQALLESEFLPEIIEISSVSTFSSPSVWSVKTKQGLTSFTLKGEEDIKKIANSDALLITDSKGVNYRIINPKKLSSSSQEILGRFK